jgi:hypothetical protein
MQAIRDTLEIFFAFAFACISQAKRAKSCLQGKGHRPK